MHKCTSKRANEIQTHPATCNKIPLTSRSSAFEESNQKCSTWNILRPIKRVASLDFSPTATKSGALPFPRFGKGGSHGSRSPHPSRSCEWSDDTNLRRIDTSKQLPAARSVSTSRAGELPPFGHGHCQTRVISSVSRPTTQNAHHVAGESHHAHNHARTVNPA
jgi:hypothetical protein